MRALLHEIIEGILPELECLRHDLHQHPEIRFEERWTSDRIADFLDKHSILYDRGFAKGTGLVATLSGARGPCVALRTEMDALEIAEETALPYASSVPGRMHACGHDGHMAALCGAAAAMGLFRAEIPGEVRFLFQPGEEVAGGARYMIEDGALDGVDAIFGMHGWPSLPLGHVGVKAGVFMAGAQDFLIRVRGVGAHGAEPGAGVDPIVITGHIILALQSIVSREVDPLEGSVVTVGIVRAGHSTNIIPETAELRGTLRALKPSVMEKLGAGVKRIAEHVAAAHRGSAEVDLGQGPYPPLTNDPGMAAFVRDTACEQLGAEFVVDLDQPFMVSEDFAFYLEKTPGAFFYLGTNPGQSDSPPKLHSPRYDFPDEALGPAVRMLTGLALRFIEANRSA